LLSSARDGETVVDGDRAEAGRHHDRAAAGGLQDGTVTLTVPAGWSPPSVHGGDPGYTAATAGHLSVSGRVITLSDVYLASGSTMSVIYGSRSGGGPGATAPRSHLGPTLWPVSEQSTTAGRLRRLR
jgi:hypothetical protein